MKAEDDWFELRVSLQSFLKVKKITNLWIGCFYLLLQISLLQCSQSRYCKDRDQTESKDNTIAGFKAILSGEYDHLPEQVFYMVGGIEEAVEKAKTLN